jgi:cytochrome c553
MTGIDIYGRVGAADIAARVQLRQRARKSDAIAVAVAVAACTVHPSFAEVAAPKSAAPQAAVACQACHGAKGEGMLDGERPRIAGQAAHYLDKQLRDFASGARESAIMGPIAKTLQDADRSKVVAYFASLPVPTSAARVSLSSAQSSRGHRLATEGSEANHVQACDNCHGPEGSGVPFSAPALAGQLAPYLATQLKSWQQGSRKNDAGGLMSSVATRLDSADIAAVTAYYASLRPQSP